MGNAISLTPGFSPVQTAEGWKNRFNGFFAAGKPLKRLYSFTPAVTRLKPGVNQMSKLLLVWGNNNRRRL
jgi:hypothetical protein